MDYVKYWGYEIAVCLVIGPLYMFTIAEGLRMRMPSLAQKLHKLPFLSPLGRYQESKKLDFAIFMAVILFFGVWLLWKKVLLCMLDPDAFRDSRWDPAAHKRLILSLGVVILGADAFLMYTGLVEMGWGESSFSLSAVLITAAYVAGIIAVSFFSLLLKPSNR